MELQKWNRLTHQYDAYVVPDDWVCTKHAEDLELYCNCPHCGKQIQVKDGYTSMEIHTFVLGLGYIVCSECYDREWERRRLCEIIDELKEAKENSDKAVKYYVDILTDLKKWIEGKVKNEVNEKHPNIWRATAHEHILDKIKELEDKYNV